jgi:hypothetical protein
VKEGEKASRAGNKAFLQAVTTAAAFDSIIHKYFTRTTMIGVFLERLSRSPSLPRRDPEFLRKLSPLSTTSFVTLDHVGLRIGRLYIQFLAMTILIIVGGSDPIYELDLDAGGKSAQSLANTHTLRASELTTLQHHPLYHQTKTGPPASRICTSLSPTPPLTSLTISCG